MYTTSFCLENPRDGGAWWAAVYGVTQSRTQLKRLSSHSSQGFPGGSDGKHRPAMKETWVQSVGWKDTLEKGMAMHRSILAWRIPWTEEPGGPQSVESQSQT